MYFRRYKNTIESTCEEYGGFSDDDIYVVQSGTDSLDITGNVFVISKTPQPVSTNLFLAFKHYLSKVKRGTGKVPYFTVTIPRKAELYEMNQFNVDMFNLGFRKTQHCYLETSPNPFEYEIRGTDSNTIVCFTLDRDPF